MPTSNRPHRGAKQSFDKLNRGEATGLQRQLTITAAILTTAQGVKGALDLRQVARERAYADAHENAKTAAANYKSAQLATQTLRDGLKKGKVAQTQAQNIRVKFADLAKEAYHAAEAVSRVTDAIDTLAKDVKERVGKNELIAAPVRSGVEQAQADAKKTLDAVLAALQDSIRAFAAASVAEDIAADPLTLGEELLGLLLEEEAKRIWEQREDERKAAERAAAEKKKSKADREVQGQPNEEKVNELAAYCHCLDMVDPLTASKSDSSTIQQVVRSLRQSAAEPNPEKPVFQPGLLDLLSDLKSVTEKRDLVCQDALTVSVLEASSAQSELDRSTEKLALLQAALKAAEAAIG